METLTLNLITPEATFFSGDATMVEAPGTLGDFGVLPGHMCFISTLKPGVVTVHNNNDVESRVFIVGGIAEVNPVSCTILAERVIALEKISLADAQADYAKAKANLDNVFEDDEIREATRELELTEAIVAALTSKE